MIQGRRRRGVVVALATGAAAYVAVPLRLSDFGLAVLNFAGIAAIAALGLNLLTGFCGQVSLGHAFFLGAGAYACAWFGDSLGLPFVVWLPLAGGVGALFGALLGSFAHRLEGHELAIVSLGLVLVGQHVFRTWESLTGGSAGRGDLPAASLGPLDFAGLRVAGRSFSADQGYFWLVWGLVALAALITANLVRSRPGRAMQAVRDRSLAADVIGVHVVRTKVAAFVVSGALAAMAGAVYGSYKRYVSPDEWGLLLSVQYVAMVIVGGLGSVLGSVIGAVFVGTVPRLVEEVGAAIPFVAGGTGGGLTVAQLNQVLFGAAIITFLLLEPRGVAALWSRWRGRGLDVTRRAAAGVSRWRPATKGPA